MLTVDIWNRLMLLGLRDAAQSLKAEIRERNKRLGNTSDDAKEKAEHEMWEIMKPGVEKLEAIIKEAKEAKKAAKAPKAPKQAAKEPDSPSVLGRPDDLEPFLDPNYSEKNPRKWLRDGLLWVASEIRRVIIDGPDGTRIDLTRAKSLPPTPWAIFCLEHFAAKPLDKRGELIMRVLPFASKDHDPGSDPIPQDDEGYLDSLD